MSRKKKLLLLFTNMLYISTFTFGGGFVIASMAKKIFTDKLGLIKEDEMLDFIAIAQSCPGAIAVNTAILIGRRLCGPAGLLVSVCGMIIPPITILCIVSYFYGIFISNNYVSLFLKGMQAGVAAVIFDVVYTLAVNVVKEKSFLLTAIMAAAFAAVVFFNVNVIAVIFASFIAGAAAAVAERNKGGGSNDIS